MKRALAKAQEADNLIAANFINSEERKCKVEFDLSKETRDSNFSFMGQGSSSLSRRSSLVLTPNLVTAEPPGLSRQLYTISTDKVYFDEEERLVFKINLEGRIDGLLENLEARVNLVAEGRETVELKATTIKRGPTFTFVFTLDEKIKMAFSQAAVFFKDIHFVSNDKIVTKKINVDTWPTAPLPYPEKGDIEVAITPVNTDAINEKKYEINVTSKQCIDAKELKFSLLYPTRKLTSSSPRKFFPYRTITNMFSFISSKQKEEIGTIVEIVEQAYDTNSPEMGISYQMLFKDISYKTQFSMQESAEITDRIIGIKVEYQDGKGKIHEVIHNLPAE